MDISAAVEQLGQVMDLTLSIKPGKTCRLIFNETLTVDLDWPDRASDRLVLSAAVGLVPADRRLDIYAMLLAANAYGRDTGDATLGVEPGSGEVVLHRALAMADLPFPAFTKAVEEFLARTAAWTARLEEARHARPAVAPVDTDIAMIRV